MGEYRPAPTRVLATIAAAVGGAMVVVYVAIILVEGNDSVYEVLPWALLMAIAAGAALIGSQVADRRTGAYLLAFVSGLFLILGWAGR